jgi:hypothetical protein
MSVPVELISEFSDAGFVLLEDIVAPAACDQLGSHLSALAEHDAGSRILLERPWCRELASAIAQDSRIAPFLPPDPVSIQCTLFDKRTEKNWLVGLHQDLSIPVQARVDLPECSGWSIKEGQLFVQPPVQVLEQLVAVRVHVDACFADNGPLRVVRGSHKDGRLSQREAARKREAIGETVLPAGRGSSLIMRPLLLHASSRSTSNAPRRVLHFLFGPPELPFGLSWGRGRFE